MKKIIIGLFLLLIVLSGCNVTKPVGKGEIKITDALERDVIFDAFPEKIIIAGKQTPMLVNFIYMFEGASEKILAIENRSQSGIEFLTILDEGVREKYSIEKGAGAEQIAPFAPDLVILKTSMQETIGEQLEMIEIPVIYVSFESIEEIYRDVRIIGTAMNESERAEEIIKYFQAVYEGIKETIFDTKTEPKDSVLMIQAVDENQKYMFSVPSEKWLQTSLVEEAGAIPIWKGGSFSGGWNEVNFEQIAAWDPDHIFIINYQGKATLILENLLDDPLWQELDAVKNDHIQAFPFDYISWDQPDPRWILGFRWLGEQINSAADFEGGFFDQVSGFYTLIFNVPEDIVQKEIYQTLRIN
jgi:iron complex transport system substrate-binding protein